MKVGLLIPCTSRGRDQWSTIKDTYLYNLSLKTFLKTQSKDYTYVIYIGYDTDDRIFSLETSHEEIRRLSPNVSFQFVQFTDIQKGHLTKMWNVLYRVAYDDQCMYFYQCGDDITFHTDGWVNDSIKELANHGNIGISGPVNNNTVILTQAMFSRTHMEIFGWMFPEEILNWCCDDWYNHVYRPNYFYPLAQHYCSNDGGIPRYDINGDSNFKMNVTMNIRRLRHNTADFAKQHIQLLNQYTTNNISCVSLLSPMSHNTRV